MDFAPLRMPLNRRLETLAVLQWILSAIFFAPLSLVAFYLMTFTYTSLAPISMLYLMWYLYDYNTPHNGGYNNVFVRKFKIWTYYRDYFPISLQKTADLDASQSYIIGYHPHGILGFGAWSSFGTDASEFANLFPKLTPRLITLNFFFKIPLVREYLMCCGILPCSSKSINSIIQDKGKAAVIVLGGASEALAMENNKDNIILKERKGFIKLALKNGSHLVPVYSFGETNSFTSVNINNNWFHKLQVKFKNITTVSTPIFYGRGIFQYTFGFIPYRKPIHVIVGKSIPVEKNESPSNKEINDLHDIYVKSLYDLFEKHKLKYGIDKDNHLNIM